MLYEYSTTTFLNIPDDKQTSRQTETTARSCFVQITCEPELEVGQPVLLGQVKSSYKSLCQNISLTWILSFNTHIYCTTLCSKQQLLWWPSKSEILILLALYILYAAIISSSGSCILCF